MEGKEVAPATQSQFVIAALASVLACGNAWANGDDADARARQRAEDEKLAAQAVVDRERRAAEEEKQRVARHQRAVQALDSTGGGCVFKPVMTDAEMAACRK